MKYDQINTPLLCQKLNGSKRNMIVFFQAAKVKEKGYILNSNSYTLPVLVENVVARFKVKRIKMTTKDFFMGLELLVKEGKVKIL